jgi:hypothetical protein
MDPVSLYFGAEQAGGLLFICIGLIGLELAYTCWRKGITAQARGGMVCLLAMAALQLVVGTTVFSQAPQAQAEVTQMVAKDRERLLSDEVPRMQSVMRRFRLFHWLEIAALFIGALLAMAARRGSTARGVGMALVPQSVVMLVFDGLAEQRGQAYLTWLQSL